MKICSARRAHLMSRFQRLRRWPDVSAAVLAAMLASLASGCNSGGSSGTPSSDGNSNLNYTASFREYVVPVQASVVDAIPGSWPDDIDFDNNGDIWFAEHHSNEVGEFIPNGAGYRYLGYAVPTPNSAMDSIAVNRQTGTVWVSENDGNKIVRLETRANPPILTEIDAATPSNRSPIPGDLAIDSAGDPWFTEPYEGGTSASAAIVHVDPSTNLLTPFPVPTQPNGLDGITFDNQGNVWFVELSVNKIGRLSKGRMTEFPLPRPNVIPTNVVVDQQGLVWVTEQASPQLNGNQGNAIAVFDPSAPVGQQWRELPIPTPNSWPAGIALDSRGNIWFTEFNASKIGVVPAGSFRVYDFAIPTPNSGPEDVRMAPDGRIFFTEQYGNKIGEITVPGLTPAG